MLVPWLLTEHYYQQQIHVVINMSPKEHHPVRGVILPLPSHHCLPSCAIRRQLRPAQQQIQVEENSHIPLHPQYPVLSPWVPWISSYLPHFQASHWSDHHPYLYYFHRQIAEGVLIFLVQRKQHGPGNHRDGVFWLPVSDELSFISATNLPVIFIT